MHGKIAIYMDSTGRGTVTNSANTFFDFNRQIWNDKKVCQVLVCLWNLELFLAKKSRRRQARSNKQNHNGYKTFKISRI